MCSPPYLRLHRDARIDGREKHGDCVFYVGVLSLSSFLHTFQCGFSGRGVHQIMLLVGGKSLTLKFVTTLSWCFVPLWSFMTRHRGLPITILVSFGILVSLSMAWSRARQHAVRGKVTA